jgi:hypothetical protein
MLSPYNQQGESKHLKGTCHVNFLTLHLQSSAGQVFVPREARVDGWPSLPCLKQCKEKLNGLSHAQSSRKRFNSCSYAHGKPLTKNLDTVLQRSSQLNHETAPARTALNKKNNLDQSPKTHSNKNSCSKAPEKKSGFIVEQKQKPLFEQKNTTPKGHLGCNMRISAGSN